MGIKFWQKKKNLDLSVIVILYNMRREARRTLYALTNAYQRDTNGISYEVIVFDNGSTEPLEENFVKKLGQNFRYIYFESDTPSPCAALNYGIQIARGQWITLLIDGARIPSPGILHYSMLASRLYEKSFIYTLGMHVGHKTQNYLAEENYSQKDEDKILDSIDWQKMAFSLMYPVLPYQAKMVISQNSRRVIV
jgi:glycosyltransferase involved in cell wall biosynthesis